MREGPARERPNALLVSQDFVRRNRWAAMLRAAGHETATCQGPFVTHNCPRLRNEPCTLREWAEVAVVEVAPGAEIALHAGSPERMCTTLPDDGRTVLLYRSTLPSDWHHARRTLPHPVDDSILAETVRAAARRK